MGFLDRVKKVAEVAVEVGTGDLDIGMAENVPPVDPGPDAWPLEEIARLEAESERRSGRAIVQGSTGVDRQEGGSRVLIDRTSVTLILRRRLADGSFGPRVQHSAVVPRDAAALLMPGTEIPVGLGPDGAVVDIDRTRMIEELRPRFAESRAKSKASGRRGLAFVKSALGEATDDLARSEQQLPSAAVEGVTAEQWLLVRTALRRPVPDGVRDRVTQQYGVPAGRWEAIDAEWSGRAAADPDLAARLARIG
jgi:hypothetical protein